jgi:hypothetical protein
LRSQELPIAAFDSLAGTKAALITGAYRFPLLGTGTKNTIPAPSTVSVIVFIDPEKVGGAGYTIGAGRGLGELRRLQTEFPALQIVLVAVTQGSFRGHDLFDHPEAEANYIHQLLSDSLQLPGTVCVIRSGFRKVPGGHAIPVANTVLDAYGLNVWEYGGHAFLVDKQGSIVNTFSGSEEDESLIRDLLERADSLPVTTPAVTPPQDSARPDSTRTVATLKPLVSFDDPSGVYFRDIDLTPQQRDTLQTLLRVQLAKGEEIFNSLRSPAAPNADPKSEEELRKANSALWTNVREANRGQLRVLLTPAQQQQFDRSVLQYDNAVTKRRLRNYPWW